MLVEVGVLFTGGIDRYVVFLPQSKQHAVLDHEVAEPRTSVHQQVYPAVLIGF